MTLRQITKIAVFCGSNTGNDPTYSQIAMQLMECLADAGITLVYGGAKSGLMGILADHMLKCNGHVVGVIPQSLVDVEIAHPNLTELHIVNSMSERKALMAKMADAYIMLPGGYGSLDEFFEMLTWSQLGYHSKPCAILNICNYYDYLLKFLDHAADQGYLKHDHRNMIITEISPSILIHKLKNYSHSSTKKWITAEISQ